jgi:pimeloyl-ACP methyl ester carboxylesterase
VIETSREHLGWVLHETGPENADYVVLLLPGALASWAFYEDLLAEPSIREAPIRFVATTLPGFGGTAPPDTLSMENYSKLASGLAADLSCDVVVGHSLGANVAIEMVSASEFSGPVVLLSPSFSRKDESMFPRVLDRLSRVLGHVPYSLALKIIGPAMKSSLPPARREFLSNELKNNDPRFCALRPVCTSPTSTDMARSPSDSATREPGPGSYTAKTTTSASRATSGRCSRELRT